jgi:hypothetical protein
MTMGSLRLPSAVAVVPSQKAIGQIYDDQQLNGWDGGGPEALVEEMSWLAREGALAGWVDDDLRRMYVCTRRYVVVLYPTQLGDAYSMGHVERRKFRDEERLLRRALVLECRHGWHLFQHVRDVPKPPARWSNHWDLVLRRWSDLADEVPRTMPDHHARYLDLLEEVVEATRELEVAKQMAAPPLPYRSWKAALEERYSARGVYAFTLVRPPTLAARAVVHLADQPDLRGRVIRVRNREVVVRFDVAVDARSIPRQGALNVLPSERAYQTQLDAIKAIRDRSAVNPDLLVSLVDHRLQSYRPDGRAMPRGPLDQSQLRVLQRALTVPDLLLVLGPPGTGKTRTITEIVAAHAVRGLRVLLTSHTNRAVDNVLEQLPPDVQCVRIGNEDAMTARARQQMVDVKVGVLTAEILSATAAAANGLAELGAGDELERNIEFTASRLDAARVADADVRARSQELEVAARRVTAPIRDQVRSAERALAACTAAAERGERRLRTWRGRLDWAAARARSGLLGVLLRWFARYSGRRVEVAERVLPRVRAELETARLAHEEWQARVHDLIASDPEAARMTASREAAVAAREAAFDDMDRTADAVRAGLAPAGLAAPVSAVDLPSRERLVEWLRRAARTGRHRAALLQEWRGCLEAAEQSLQRELVRYADVVAATCIGTATSPLLAELQFDLVIVDEAGQVSLPTLLVPLVRARRAILVGDHMQLPPFVDDEVRRWTDQLAGTSEVPPESAELIADVLRKSAFEQLYGHMDDSHRDMLRTQRRMPPALAEFVSRQFYSGFLETEHAGGPPDPIFRCRFAMVDTSDRSAGEREERRTGGGEEWNERGVVNELEALLIRELVVQYARWYPNWAVIVPYRAQAARIVQLLGAALGGSADVDESVNTVDSFQGGERDLVVYGFTRSNEAGDVGFLRELRRINVAITRAKQQLVLVGDLDTLLRSRDPGFGNLMRSIKGYLDSAGDVRASREFEDCLRGLAAERL